ncbi:MAG TPA: MerR family transcriptional regulator, partial [Cyanobacteria bacterium UBA11367]|nr:MerR family transcriptional regulator [Cyanobacteria bacterium UBA11367]
SKERSLSLVEFDLERAIASVKAGEPVIPVWLDSIHRSLASRLA